MAEIRMISNKRHLNKKYIIENNKNNIIDYIHNRNPYFITGNVRGGLGNIFDLLKLKKNDFVLLPAIVPQGLLSPIRKKKLRIIYYKSNEFMQIDLNSILKLINKTNSIKVIIVIHYFGIPQKLDDLMTVCKKSNIVVLEDCVHALFSEYDNGQAIGTQGDISFFSFPKFLPVPDGGIFYVNTNTIQISHLNYSISFSNKISVLFHYLYLRLKEYEFNKRNKFIKALSNKISRLFYGCYYYCIKNDYRPSRMSVIANKILSNIEYISFIKKRKQNIDFIYNKLNKSKYKFILQNYDYKYNLTGFPIIVSNRAKLIKNLKSRQIQCLIYNKNWYCNNSEDFQTENKIFHQHLLLPINEDLDQTELTKMIMIMNEL